MIFRRLASGNDLPPEMQSRIQAYLDIKINYDDAGIGNAISAMEDYVEAALRAWLERNKDASGESHEPPLH